MNGRNNGVGEDNILQNQFTAYLLTAIRRRRLDYLKSAERLRMFESFPYPDKYSDDNLYDHILFETLPVLEQIENQLLHRSLQRVKARNLSILLSRAVEEKAFTEIAAELGISYHSVVMAYNRVIRRIQKELEVELREFPGNTTKSKKQ